MDLGEDFNGRGWRGPLYQADEFRFQLDPEDEELVTEEPWVGNPDGSASWYDGPEDKGAGAATTPAWDPPAAPATPGWDGPATAAEDVPAWDGPREVDPTAWDPKPPMPGYDGVGVDEKYNGGGHRNSTRPMSRFERD